MPSCGSVLQIGVDKNDVNKVFIQLTLEFLTKEVKYSTSISSTYMYGYTVNP